MPLCVRFQPALTISGGPDSANDRGDRAPAPGRGSGGPRGNGGGERGRGRGRSFQPPPPPSPWTGYFAPYGIALPAPRPGWTPPNAAGVLGPRPGVHSQAYTMMLPGPPASLPAPPASSPYHFGASSWDHAALFNQAYSQHGLPAHGTDWILDSGAATHVTGNAGSSNQDNTHDVQ
nr:ribosomal large subunit pseudouridine synthase B-like [Aegilops tauschii subsp. strangulata]